MIPEEHKETFIEIFRRNLGLVYISCDKAQISPSTFYRWMKDDKEFKAKIEHEKERLVDLAESSLLLNVQNGNVPSTIFYLKCKGKNRGYSEEPLVSNNVNHFNLGAKIANNEKAVEKLDEIIELVANSENGFSGDDGDVSDEE